MLTSALLWLVKDALFFLAYVSGRSAFAKPLNAKEEAHCIARMQAGDAQAKNELVEHNMRLVAHIARKYTVPGYDADDLISIGTIGLIKGVSTFKSGTGTQLSTYCARCIENEIPVSYTHLDVYKRQRIFATPRGASSSPCSPPTSTASSKW